MKKCYLVGDTVTGLVKIGHTSNMKKRLSTMMTSNLNLMLLLLLPYDLEDELHKIFKDKRVGREWFKLEEADIKGVIDLNNEYLKRELE